MSLQDETGPDRDELLTFLARDLVGREPESEDVAQDVWLILQRHPPERVRSLRPWLKVAIRNLAMRSRQRDRRREERERLVARSDCEPSVLEQLERKSQQERLALLVDELREPYRSVVRLRYLEEREFEEIAAMVGQPPATVRMQLKRGLDQLRARLGVEPKRRTGFQALFPWSWWRPRRASREVLEHAGGLAAIVVGLAVVGLVLGVFLFEARETGAQLVAAAPHGSTTIPTDSVPILSSTASTQSAELTPPDSESANSRTQLAAPDKEAPDESAVQTVVPEDAWTLDVEGKVIDPDGRPVPDVSVMVGNEDGSGTRIVARSDSDGRYRAEGVEGRGLMWAEHEDWVSSQLHLIATKPTGSALDLRLGHRIGTLTGRVFTWQGLPVSGAEVELLSSNVRFVPSDQRTLAQGLQKARARTEADGRFRLGLPLTRAFRLVVRSDAYSRYIVSVTPESGASKEIDVTLPPPCALEGQVHRTDGSVAVGVHLELTHHNREMRVFPRSVGMTDEEGSFRFEGLPEGSYVLRLLEDPSGSTASCFVEGHLSAGERAQLGVMLEEDHTLRGRAFDGDLPLAGWKVELERLPLQSSGGSHESRTGPDGTFEFRSCSLADSYVLRLFRPGATSAAADLALPDLVAIVRADAGEVVLRTDAASRPGSLAGHFARGLPGPLPVVAALRREHCTPMLLRIHPETGEFSAGSLPAGQYRLRAWIPELGVWDAAAIDILPGERTELELAPPMPGTLRVQPEGRDPATFVSWTVTVSMPTLQDSAEASVLRIPKTAAKDAFSLELPPGEYECSLSFDNVDLEHHRVRIEPGSTTILKATLPEPIIITLRLDLDRTLRREESVSLIIRAAEGERSLDLSPKRTSPSETFRVLLTRDVQELHVRTSLGLSGKLALCEADIVAGGELGLKLTNPEPGATVSR